MISMSEIINHLWQSTILTAVAAAISLTLRNHHASTRYWIWLAASLKFLFPLSLLVMFGTRVDAPPSLATIVPAESVVPVIVNSFAPAAPVHASTDWLPVLAIVWLLGSAILIARWIRNWLRLRAT